ncbi:threonine dehydratase, partial [Pseudomonas syringae pv. actinidiae ICMP 19100]
RGVVTASAGNHAQGLALAAKELGILATIVMPRTTPEIKVEGVRSRGATVVLHGDSFPEALTPTPLPDKAPWRWKSSVSSRGSWTRSLCRSVAAV